MKLPSVSASILISALLISFSILLSGGVIRIKGINSTLGGTNSGLGTAQAPTDSVPAPETPTGPVKVSFDDDPVLGDKNAPVTIVEFSDYECPFCKRYFDQTYPEIKKNYVDTGKVKIVFRDLPLSFHQNAHKEAQAANCVKEQGGDAAYYKYHDEMFKRTTSNGTGLALSDLPKIATELGYDGNKVQQCLDSDKYKEEVDKDLADASSYGANGTPSFFIGKSGDGSTEASILVGAQPYSVFQSTIDALLK